LYPFLPEVVVCLNVSIDQHVVASALFS